MVLSMNISLYTNIFSLRIISLLLVLFFLTGCESGPYFYLMNSCNKEIIKNEKNKIFIELKISEESSINNRLKVINQTGNTIDIMPKNFYMKVIDTEIKMPVKANYRRFIKKRMLIAKSLCNDYYNPYTCIDHVSKLYKELKNNAFQFGSIEPDGDVEGFFAFDLPDAFNKTELKKDFTKALKQGKNISKGNIIVGVETKQRTIEFEFPIGIQIYDNMENIPERRKLF